VTIVGELTGGGAHTVSERRLDEKFTIRIPWGKVIVPNLKDDWEGVGIEPDVKVAGSEALKTAHMLALEKLLVGVPAGPRRNSLEQAKEAVSHYR
jgi:C-terminal processing protease CtpA/Prc